MLVQQSLRDGVGENTIRENNHFRIQARLGVEGATSLMLIRMAFSRGPSTFCEALRILSNLSEIDFFLYAFEARDQLLADSANCEGRAIGHCALEKSARSEEVVATPG
jgi:hypothetical protein